MERFARESLERDPAFRDGAARRLLGTLYVMAGKHVKHGDSEDGLELLEGVVDEYPHDPSAHLRLAEGYIALGDPDAALESLCVSVGDRGELRVSEQRLLAALLEDLGGAEALGCGG